MAVGIGRQRQAKPWLLERRPQDQRNCGQKQQDRALHDAVGKSQLNLDRRHPLNKGYENSMTGSLITVSNAGMHDVSHMASIINPAQSTRARAQRLGERLGRTVLVDNRAGGSIGTEAVVSGDADGTTISLDVDFEPNTLDSENPHRGPDARFRELPRSQWRAKLQRKPKSFADHYSRARRFWRSMTPPEQSNIVNAFTFELSKVETPPIEPVC